MCHITRNELSITFFHKKENNQELNRIQKFVFILKKRLLLRLFMIIQYFSIDFITYLVSDMLTSFTTDWTDILEEFLMFSEVEWYPCVLWRLRITLLCEYKNHLTFLSDKCFEICAIGKIILKFCSLYV